MTRTEAEALAREVRGATGYAARVEFEVELSEFAVRVPIAPPRSGAISEEFRLGDEADWHWLRNRIENA